MQLGYLDQSGVDRVLEKQRKINLRFGEIALHEGILTPEQLEHALDVQRTSQVRLGEALLRIRALTPERLQQELGEFARLEEESLKEEKSRRESLPHAEFIQCIVDMTRTVPNVTSDLVCSIWLARRERRATAARG